MKSIITVCILAAITGITFAQTGAKTQQNKIHGIWHNNDFGYQMTLMLQHDGNGEFDGEAITFTAQANKLVINQSGVTNTYTFALNSNSLILSGGDLDNAIVFTRSGSAEQLAAETKTTSPTETTSSKLLGSWTLNGETIEFKSTGQCNYLGQHFLYSVSGNNLTIQTSQGNVVFGYSIAGDKLTLSANGQNLTYTKGNTTVASAQIQSTGNKKLDLSLVGKWCYVNVTSTNSGGTSTDACITINGDGTYSYHSERSMSANTSTFSAGTASQNSDNGTWWVEGDRIFYNSQTQGQGSYQLVKQNHPKNGDPMIVLDGTSYVTYFQKSPW